MLFYSGRTAYMGEVDHGNTVTDYLAQERERGITVCSSAVTMAWNHKKLIRFLSPLFFLQISL